MSDFFSNKGGEKNSTGEQQMAKKKKKIQTKVFSREHMGEKSGPALLDFHQEKGES